MSKTQLSKSIIQALQNAHWRHLSNNGNSDLFIRNKALLTLSRSKTNRDLYVYSVEFMDERPTQTGLADTPTLEGLIK